MTDASIVAHLCSLHFMCALMWSDLPCTKGEQDQLFYLQTGPLSLCACSVRQLRRLAGVVFERARRNLEVACGSFALAALLVFFRHTCLVLSLGGAPR